MPKKVLIIVGDATETVDTLYPYYRLIEAGFQPIVAAPEKRLYQMVMHEVRPGWTITREWEGYQIQADVAFYVGPWIKLLEQARDAKQSEISV